MQKEIKADLNRLLSDNEIFQGILQSRKKRTILYRSTTTKMS